MKKVHMIIITLIIILLIACVGFSVLYFATDIFKSDKEMFVKYAGQVDLKDFINLEEYSNYLERTENESHSDNAEINITLSRGDQEVNEKIKISGNSDPVNSRANYDISVNQGDQALLEMNYLKVQDFNGILFKNIVNQYIVLENNNLKEFATKMGTQDVESVPDKIELNNKLLDINNEEVNAVVSKYLTIAIEEIPADNFYKLEKADITLGDNSVEADGFGADVKLKDLQKILIKVFENARDDEQLFNIVKKVNSNVTVEDYQNYIDENIEQISGEIPDEENVKVLTISVYKQGKQTVKLDINIIENETDNIEIAIEKNNDETILRLSSVDVGYNSDSQIIFEVAKTSNSEQQENYNITISTFINGEEETRYDINLSRTGLLNANNFGLKFAIKFTSKEGIVENIELANTTNFTSVPEIEEFKEGNHLVINNLSQEQIINLFTNLGNMLSEKLKDEMLISIVRDLPTINKELYEEANKATQNTQNAIEQEQNLSSGEIQINGQTYNSVEEYVNSNTDANTNANANTDPDPISQLNAQAIQVFNSQFTVYEGTRKGAEIKSLQRMIETNNISNTEHIVTYTGVESEKTVATKTYKVSFEKDAQGYINKVIVEEN